MNLIITGNPGVGKHTVAAQIMKNEDYDMIDINKIAIESNYIEKDEIGIQVDVQNLRKDLNKKISTKSLIVGHLAPYDAISEFGTEKTFQIDTTTKTPQEVVEKIQKIIQEHDNDDNVDWLSEINEKDDLQKFFDY